MKELLYSNGARNAEEKSGTGIFKFSCSTVLVVPENGVIIDGEDAAAAAALQ